MSDEPRARWITVDPPTRPWLRAKCEASVQPATARWRYIAHRPNDDCDMKAWVVIDGKAYCKRHAGAVALKILLGDVDDPTQTDPR